MTPRAIGVSLSDEMSFRLLPEQATRDELVCSDKTLAIDDSNLVIKVLVPIMFNFYF